MIQTRKGWSTKKEYTFSGFSRNFFIELKKPHSESALAHFGTKTSKPDFSQKESLGPNLKLYVAVTLCNKSENYHALIFHKT